MEKKHYFIIMTVLLLISLVNYPKMEELNSIRINDFFLGFFAGILIALLLAGMTNYSKLKKRNK